ncbi:MAG TPA: type II toxin-antitoxin system HicA family toxin [Blastocatellia bacterium]
MTYREITRKLRALGCYEVHRRGAGSHRKWVNPNAQLGATFPDWGSRDLKTGTLRAAIKRLGIDWADFEKA